MILLSLSIFTCLLPELLYIRVTSITLGSLSMQRFWATDVNRKCSVFLFNRSSHHHLYIAKCLFSSREDLFENLAETTALACEMLTSGCRPWLKNVACLLGPYCLSFETEVLWQRHLHYFFKINKPDMQCIPDAHFELHHELATSHLWLLHHIFHQRCANTSDTPSYHPVLQGKLGLSHQLRAR